MATVLIIGASRGLGLEFVRQYAAAGARVLATVRQPAAGRAVSEAGGEVYLCDVGDQASIRRLADGLDGIALDLVVHNAGIFGADQPFGAIEAIDLLEVMRIDTVAPLLTAQALAGRLAPGGVFAAVSSRLGSIGANQDGGHYGYRAAKAALNMVIRTLAVDLAARGAGAVALSPGWVRTDMGGPEAPLAPAEAVAGMRAVLDRLTPADSGGFFDYDGCRLPW